MNYKYFKLQKKVTITGNKWLNEHLDRTQNNRRFNMSFSILAEREKRS
jgi:hypothetical protein